MIIWGRIFNLLHDNTVFYLAHFFFSRNHCAYVVEKSVSYNVHDGAAPYVKAEYKKCGWGKKCPGLR